MKKKKLFQIEEKLKVLQALSCEESGRLRGGVDPLPPLPTPTPKLTLPPLTFPPTLPVGVTVSPGGITGTVTLKF